MITLEKNLKYESNASREYFMLKMNKNERVTAKAIRFDYNNQVIDCTLSNTVSAILPMSEVVPQELKVLQSSSSNYFSYPEICSIIGKKIGVFITYYDTNLNKFIISRRDSMLKAFEEIKKENIIDCDIKTMTNTALYVDCGYGIPGLIYISECAKCRIRSVKDSFKIGNIIRCKILSINENDTNLTLSRIQAVDEEGIKLNVNDIVYGKVRERYSNENDKDNQQSYYFEILPYNLVGFVNIFNYNLTLNYNDELICNIVKITPEGKYKLKMINFLN